LAGNRKRKKERKKERKKKEKKRKKDVKKLFHQCLIHTFSCPMSILAETLVYTEGLRFNGTREHTVYF
jgi:hypothetical protein